MASAATSTIVTDVLRIREWSKNGWHEEALAAAETLAASAPENRDALYLIAANQRCLNRITEALATLQRLEQFHPRFSLLYQERGHCYTALRDAPHAIEAFVCAVTLNPALISSWSVLERLYRMTGQPKNAAVAAQQLAALGQLPPEIVHAGGLFSDGEFSAAEKTLRTYLRDNGNHVEALRLLARVEQRLGALEEAERLLEETLKLAPDYVAASMDYALVLLDRQKFPQAHEVLKTLVNLAPANTNYLSPYATACLGLGRNEEAIAAYRQALAASPTSYELHVPLGHALKSVGQQEKAIESYKAALAARPNFGDAYWSLANLKTYRFSADEIASMHAAESASTTGDVDRYHLCFALGKAYEDQKDYAESWKFYARGNELKRAEGRYDPALLENEMRKLSELCTEAFFAERKGAGAQNADPIFIVGLPRSGSTLLEQILASHSVVEGTQELHDIQRIAHDMRASMPNAQDVRYPAALAGTPQEEFRRLGERYINETRAYRTSKPFFIDKMPNNFRHVGLIRLILPNAKIIDMRREPMACCFSNLKQLFAGGQEFTYSMGDIAHYYRTYLDLMAHWNAVLPGGLLRVCYEDLVEDLEVNVRRILEFCGLKFEPACVEFHKTERSVSTPSSEQVRQPIFREALDQWHNYEPWLGPLKTALGDAVTRYSL
jgi:tetratricopeptide (TPR) repeat protein